MPCREQAKAGPSRFFLYATAAVALVTLSACTADVPPAACQDPNFDCYFDQALKGITAVRENIIFWARLKLTGELLAFVAGIVATVMIALQGDENKKWTRPIGLIATALVTGITSGLVSFHVTDNIDKLIDVMGSMAAAVNDFDSEVTVLRGGRSKEQLEADYANDQQFREKVNAATKKFVTDYNKIKIDMLKLQGTAAKLATIPSAPNGTSRPANN